MDRRPAVIELFTTFVTVAEIRYGLALLSEGARKNALKQAIEGMFEEDFSGRILPFDGSAARVYAGIAAGCRQPGRPVSQFDALIAAIARSRAAAVATRNSRGRRYPGYQSVERPIVKTYFLRLDLPDHSLYKTACSVPRYIRNIVSTYSR